MAITMTEWKAAIEAQIAAATSSTSLDDLTFLKANSDLWLANNEGGSIAGYTSLENLLQTVQNAVTVSTNIVDLTFLGKAAYSSAINVNAIGGGGGFKNKTQITTSGNWTVPAGVYEVGIWGTGGGGAGSAASSAAPGNGSGGAGATVVTRLAVTPGQVFQVIVGAGSLGVSNGSGTVGGTTTVRIGSLPVLSAEGGQSANSSSAGTGSNVVYAFDVVSLMKGGDGQVGVTTSTPGVAGLPAGMPNKAGSGFISVTNQPVAAGGAAGSVLGAGAGGGSSIYGVGGVGGKGSNSNTTPNSGANAPETSYGAGGGGASGRGSTPVLGGSGANGIVEIYY